MAFQVEYISHQWTNRTLYKIAYS